MRDKQYLVNGEFEFDGKKYVIHGKVMAVSNLQAHYYAIEEIKMFFKTNQFINLSATASTLSSSYNFVRNQPMRLSILEKPPKEIPDPSNKARELLEEELIAHHIAGKSVTYINDKGNFVAESIGETGSGIRVIITPQETSWFIYQGEFQQGEFISGERKYQCKQRWIIATGKFYRGLHIEGIKSSIRGNRTSFISEGRFAGNYTIKNAEQFAGTVFFEYFVERLQGDGECSIDYLKEKGFFEQGMLRKGQRITRIVQLPFSKFPDKEITEIIDRDNIKIITKLKHRSGVDKTTEEIRKAQDNDFKDHLKFYFCEDGPLDVF